MKRLVHDEGCIESSSCKKCLRRIYLRNWYSRNKDKAHTSTKKWRLKSPEKVRVINRKSRNNNLDKNRFRVRQWFKKNPKMASFYTMLRRTTKIQATPKWADLNKISEIYKNCPKGKHVDHIIPLRGKDVCGLHVEYNLQYLSPSENSSKGNKLKL